jgi:hypothetical protein
MSRFDGVGVPLSIGWVPLPSTGRIATLSDRLLQAGRSQCVSRRSGRVRREAAPAARAGERDVVGSFLQRAISSGGERFVHTEEVTGSIPVSPTAERLGQRLTASQMTRPFVMIRLVAGAFPERAPRRSPPVLRPRPPACSRCRAPTASTPAPSPTSPVRRARRSCPTSAPRLGLRSGTSRLRGLVAAPEPSSRCGFDRLRTGSGRLGAGCAGCSLPPAGELRRPQG